MFVNRQAEMRFLNTLLERPRAQMALLYGRRRIGKTVLLRHWLEQADAPYTYWAASKAPAALQRREFYARILDVPPEDAPRVDSWASCWERVAKLLANRRHILILDELNYAIESDPAPVEGMLSALQNAWDQFFRESQLRIVLCGSHQRMMEAILQREAPLFGRLTGQWQLQPLPFSALREFFPGWTAEERVAGYAILGGVAGYWDWLDASKGLSENLQRMLEPGSMFVAEPLLLLYDEIREPAVHLAILRAIGAGRHTAGEIAEATLVASAHLSAYLDRLRELRLIEKRLPVTVAVSARDKAKTGRWHLVDPFFRWFFRFVAPYRDELDYHPEQVVARIRDGLRAFVGVTAFEELARQWVYLQGHTGKMAWLCQEAGSFWSPAVQVDVVGIHWERQEIVLGECKWGLEKVDQGVVNKLLAARPEVLKKLPGGGEGWHVHYALFSRGGFTPAARTAAKAVRAELVDLARLDRDLQQVE